MQILAEKGNDPWTWLEHGNRFGLFPLIQRDVHIITGFWHYKLLGVWTAKRMDWLILRQYT